MTEKYMKHIDECGMYYYICNEEEIIAEAFYGDDAQDIVDLLNKQEEKINNLKNNLFSVTSALIYETSTNPRKEIEEAKKEIYGDD